MDTAASLPMVPALRSLGRRFAMIVAIAAVAMLGDLRVAVSHPVQGALGWIEPFDRPVPNSAPVASVDALIATTTGDPEDAASAPVGRGSRSRALDDGGLVPAIYSRDSDTRFAYFRHVSKWM